MKDPRDVYRHRWNRRRKETGISGREGRPRSLTVLSQTGDPCYRECKQGGCVRARISSSRRNLANEKSLVSFFSEASGSPGRKLSEIVALLLSTVPCSHIWELIIHRRVGGRLAPHVASLECRFFHRSLAAGRVQREGKMSESDILPNRCEVFNKPLNKLTGLQRPATN